jgi:hypothetical protein
MAGAFANAYWILSVLGAIVAVVVAVIIRMGTKK